MLLVECWLSRLHTELFLAKLFVFGFVFFPAALGLCWGPWVSLVAGHQVKDRISLTLSFLLHGMENMLFLAQGMAERP